MRPVDGALFGVRCQIVFKHVEVKSLRAGHSTTPLTVGRLIGVWPTQILWALIPEFKVESCINEVGLYNYYIDG